MNFSSIEQRAPIDLTTPPLMRGGGHTRVEEARSARVSVRPFGDPTDEVRTTLAQLTARAQKLVSEETDSHVVRSGRRLCELAKKQAEDSRKLAKRATAGDIFGGSQGSVELFMSRYLNLDIREQQRLLYRLQAAQNQMARDIGSGTTTTATGREPLSTTVNMIKNTNNSGNASSAVYGDSGGVMTRNDVDLFLEGLQSRILTQIQLASHQKVREQVLKQENALFKAAWRTYYLSLADEAEVLAMRGGDAANSSLMVKGKSAPELTAIGSSSGALSQLLGSQSLTAEAIQRKISAFANIVERFSPTQWMMRFSAYVQDEGTYGRNDALSLLYITVERIFEPLQRHGLESADLLACVAASQQVMEEKALSRFFSSAMRIDPSRTEELSNMFAPRVLEMISRQSSASDLWGHVFDAMRIGRYDVAVEASRRVGNKCLESALSRLAEATSVERHRLPPLLDLRELYAEPQTAENVHRRAVLFLLLNGSTGESHEATQRVLLQLCSKVAQSLEDVLWMRFFSIRELQSSAKVPPVQTLSFTQKIILDDLLDLISMTRGDTVRVASFLLHALLPASGLRLLLESEPTMYVDGFHLALCLNRWDMLSSPCSQEVPLDLGKHTQRYCSLVLLDVSRQQMLLPEQDPLPGVAIFSYFHKAGFDEAFTEFCTKDSIAAQLFGHFNAFDGQGGLLLGANPSPPSEELLQAMSQIAELAALRHNTPLAIHLLLVQANSAMTRGGSRAIVGRALRRALQLACPAIAQALHLPPREPHVAALLAQSAQLQALRRCADLEAPDDPEPAADRHTFDLLCAMAACYQAEAAGALEDVLRLFFALPFAPGPGREDTAPALAGAPADVLTAAAALLPLVFRAAGALLRAADTGGRVSVKREVSACVLSPAELPVAGPQRASQIVQAMRPVVAWVRRCGGHSSNGAMLYGACAKEVMDFEQRYLV